VKIDDGIDYVLVSRHNKGPKDDILKREKKEEEKKEKKTTTKKKTKTKTTELQTLAFGIKNRISKRLS
jgi:hypothetical protein